MVNIIAVSCLLGILEPILTYTSRVRVHAFELPTVSLEWRLQIDVVPYTCSHWNLKDMAVSDCNGALE
jgi:hypothetical protein